MRRIQACAAYNSTFANRETKSVSNGFYSTSSYYSVMSFLFEASGFNAKNLTFEKKLGS